MRYILLWKYRSYFVPVKLLVRGLFKFESKWYELGVSSPCLHIWKFLVLKHIYARRLVSFAFQRNVVARIMVFQDLLFAQFCNCLESLFKFLNLGWMKFSFRLFKSLHNGLLAYCYDIFHCVGIECLIYCVKLQVM